MHKTKVVKWTRESRAGQGRAGQGRGGAGRGGAGRGGAGQGQGQGQGRGAGAGQGQQGAGAGAGAGAGQGQGQGQGRGRGRPGQNPILFPQAGGIGTPKPQESNDKIRKADTDLGLESKLQIHSTEYQNSKPSTLDPNSKP